MNKISFLIYLDYEEQFNLLTDEQLGQLMRAIMQYEKTGEIGELDVITKMAFSFIKVQLDRDREKYNEICQRNKENGAKGGRPRKEEIKNREVFEKTEWFSEKPKKPEEDEEVVEEKETDAEEDNKNSSNSGKSDSCVDGSFVNNSCDDDLQKIADFYEKNIGFLGSYGADILLDYAKEMSVEVVIYAMQKAVEADKRTIQYIKGILNNWSKKGIKTLVEAKKESDLFRNSKQTKQQDNIRYLEDGTYIKDGLHYMN